MYLTQEKPYRPLLIALIFLTLPLALLLHEIITVGLFRHSAADLPKRAVAASSGLG